MSWIIISIGILLSSPIMYLFVRKEKELNKDIAIQNLSIFLIPTIVYFVYNLISKTSMIIEFKYFLMLLGAALLFSLLGNIFSMKAIQLASNPGYSLMIQKSYTIFTTIMSVFLFGSSISVKSVIAIIIVLCFVALIIVEKSDKKDENKKWIIYTFGAFFAFGFLSLANTYFGKQGITSTVINFYICLIVTLSFLIQIFVKKIKLSFDKKSIGVFIGAGIPASIFNFCLIQGYLVAPNPGYISAVNVASISLLTVLYRVFFKDTLTLKKMLGVIGILIGLIILFV